MFLSQVSYHTNTTNHTILAREYYTRYCLLYLKKILFVFISCLFAAATTNGGDSISRCQCRSFFFACHYFYSFSRFKYVKPLRGYPLVTSKWMGFDLPVGKYHYYCKDVVYVEDSFAIPEVVEDSLEYFPLLNPCYYVFYHHHSHLGKVFVVFSLLRS